MGKSGLLIIWWLLSSVTILLIYLCSLVLFYHVSHFINSNSYLACTHITISFYEWLNMLFAFRSCSVWSALEYELERKVGKLLVTDWLPVARYTTEELPLKHGWPPITLCQIQANVVQKWTFATTSRNHSIDHSSLATKAANMANKQANISYLHSFCVLFTKNRLGSI